jgi:glutamine amidotransferase-like uncharacterized protein
MTELLKKISKQDIRNTLALMLVGGCMIFLYTLLKYKIPAENKDIVSLLGGNFFTLLSVLAGYYWGSSKVQADRSKSELEKDQEQ